MSSAGRRRAGWSTRLARHSANPCVQRRRNGTNDHTGCSSHRRYPVSCGAAAGQRDRSARRPLGRLDCRRHSDAGRTPGSRPGRNDLYEIADWELHTSHGTLSRPRPERHFSPRLAPPNAGQPRFPYTLGELTMRYGYWMPVFGGWLRNVEDENMAPTWEYNKRLAQRSEQIGFDLSLVAELNLNDIKGEEAPSLDAWSTAAALMAVTENWNSWSRCGRRSTTPRCSPSRPRTSTTSAAPGRLSLNVVSSWWKDEATKYGVHFEQHDDRYARTAEWLEVRGQHVEARPRQLRGQVLPSPRHRPAAQAGDEAAAGDLCRRRIRGREEPHRQDLRRLRHARRPARAHRGEDRGHVRPPRPSSAFRP